MNYVWATENEKKKDLRVTIQEPDILTQFTQTKDLIDYENYSRPNSYVKLELESQSRYPRMNSQTAYQPKSILKNKSVNSLLPQQNYHPSGEEQGGRYVTDRNEFIESDLYDKFQEQAKKKGKVKLHFETGVNPYLKLHQRHDDRYDNLYDRYKDRYAYGGGVGRTLNQSQADLEKSREIFQRHFQSSTTKSSQGGVDLSHAFGPSQESHLTFSGPGSHSQTHSLSILNQSQLQNSDISSVLNARTFTNESKTNAATTPDFNCYYFVLPTQQLIKFNLNNLTFGITKINFPFKSYSQIQLPQHQIFLCGGKDQMRSNPHAQTFIMNYENPKQIQLLPKQSLKVVRFDHFLVLMDRFVYCLGGRGVNGVSLKNCERFDLFLNEWETIAEMNYAHPNLRACASQKNQIIYAMGTPFFLGKSLIIEQYSQFNNVWTLLEVKIPKELDLVSFLRNLSNFHLSYHDTNLYSDKKSFYFFATSKEFGDLSFLIDCNDPTDPILNRLKPLTLQESSSVVLKSYECIVFDLKNYSKATRYSLGNWKTQEFIFKENPEKF